MRSHTNTDIHTDTCVLPPPAQHTACAGEVAVLPGCQPAAQPTFTAPPSSEPALFCPVAVAAPQSLPAPGTETASHSLYPLAPAQICKDGPGPLAPCRHRAGEAGVDIPPPPCLHIPCPTRMHTCAHTRAHTCEQQQRGFCPVHSHTRALNSPSPDPTAPRSLDGRAGQVRTVQRPAAVSIPCAEAVPSWEWPLCSTPWVLPARAAWAHSTSLPPPAATQGHYTQPSP